MTLLSALIPLAYQLAALLLILYGCFILTSLALFFIHRRRHDWPAAPELPGDWPAVTVQIPVYNEPAVATRILQAAAAFDYPPERLHIQVLDDSTDQTSAALAALIGLLRRTRGLRISYHRRRQRQGYKAGALAAALPAASGEFIAIFDADFAPPPDWLRRTVPALLRHPRLAFVQTRWGHLNRGQNPLTAAQGLALDGHFVVEQQARSAASCMQNFNGSGGIWRRQAIVEAGGWTADTVTEDLDLAYRAQLRGWRGAYLNCVQAPAEVPPTLSGFRRQQRRWAKGSLQTLRKLAPAIVRSAYSLPLRLYALIHLGGYAIHVPLLGLLLLTLPLALLPNPHMPLPMVGILSPLISVAPFLMYGVAQYSLAGKAGLRRLWALPILALLSLGLSPSVAKAVIEGALRRGGVFERTPKQGNRPYPQVPADVHWRDFWPEALVLAYSLLTLTVVSTQGHVHLAPLPVLYTLGCTFVLSLGASEHAQARVQPQRGARYGKPMRPGDALPTGHR